MGSYIEDYNNRVDIISCELHQQPTVQLCLSHLMCDTQDCWGLYILAWLAGWQAALQWMSHGPLIAWLC